MSFSLFSDRAHTQTGAETVAADLLLIEDISRASGQKLRKITILEMITALWFVRGGPVTKTADFSLAATESWVINNKSGSTCVVTLPAASSWTGREVTFKNTQAQLLNSASANVVPSTGGAAAVDILTAVSGRWATLVSDGTNWIVMKVGG